MNVNTTSVRNSIKILLLNNKKELLLMCYDDPKITSTDGIYRGRFWFPIGGEIEAGESLINAAIRELKEETGINKTNVTFGPIVWYGEFDMIFSGQLTRLKQQFIVAHTDSKLITKDYLTDEEKEVIKDIKWFNFEQICNHNEIIYPVVLKDCLPDVLNGNYPEKPIWIDLAKQP